MYPRLSLDPARPPEEGDRVYIIQHPEGLPKQIGMHRNLVVHVDDRVVQYLTDTKGGSSGSPVFNDRWGVVALHSRWVEVPRADGRASMFRNQGVRIERVREGLASAGII
jgi:V8-like Glu-specific endopeptidase